MSTPLGKSIVTFGFALAAVPIWLRHRPLIMDGSSIDGGPKPPLNLPAKTHDPRSPRRISMRVRAPHAFFCAALSGALLSPAWFIPARAEAGFIRT